MYKSEIIAALARKAGHITDAVFGPERQVLIRDKSQRPIRKGKDDKGEVGLDWTPDEATIWVTPGQPLHHIFHACLHLYRYWIEGAPQYWDLKRGCQGNLLEIENCFEHLVIIPVEIAYFPEAYSYWINSVEEGLRAVRRGGSGENLPRLFWLYALTRAAFPRSQVAEEVRLAAEEFQVLRECENLTDSLLENYDHKAFVLENFCLHQLKHVPSTLGVRSIGSPAAHGGRSTVWTSLKDYRASPAVQSSGDEDVVSWGAEVMPLSTMSNGVLTLD